MDIDWNEVGKNLVIDTLAEEGGEVGVVLGLLVDQLWPPGESVWDSIRADIQALINQSLSQAFAAQVQDILTGLQDSIVHYQASLKDSRPETARDEWIALQVVFDTNQPLFQHNGADGDYRVLLLRIAPRSPRRGRLGRYPRGYSTISSPPNVRQTSNKGMSSSQALFTMSSLRSKVVTSFSV
jgi:hypothetical protein